MLNGTLVLGILLGVGLLALVRSVIRRLNVSWRLPWKPRLTYSLGERRRQVGAVAVTLTTRGAKRRARN